MNEAVGPGLLDVLRVLAALALVSGVAVLVGNFMRRRGLGRSAGRTLRVDERLGVGRGVQLMVVEVEGRRLLLGVSEAKVSLVTELAEAEEVPAAAEEAKPQDKLPNKFPSTLDFAKLLASRMRSAGRSS